MPIDALLPPPDSVTTVRCSLLFDGTGDVARNVVLTLRGGRIVDRQNDVKGTTDIAWDQCAVVPPLVNAHTHLEFSQLEQPIAAGADFSQWLDAVIATRQSNLPGDDAAAVQEGIRQSADLGVQWIGEIATRQPPPDAGVPASPPVRGRQFLELLSVDSKRATHILDEAERFIRRRQATAAPSFQPGLSPHAPYSTSLALVDGAAQLARRYDVPIAMHVAETESELQLLDRQTGPLAEFLKNRQLWPPAHLTSPTPVMHYLQVLSRAPRALIVHGNYLHARERDLLARRPQMSLVYCPRTHSHFGHAPYPLSACLAEGIRVVLGTDSRASSPDLSIWAEVQHAAALHADAAPRRLLATVTTDAAIALGETPRTLSIGNPASFSVIRLDERLPPGRATEHSADLLLRAGSHPIESWSMGQRCILPAH